MTNKDKILGRSSTDFASWIVHTFILCNNCPAYYSTCEIKDTEEGCYKPNCIKEIARWLDSEVDKDVDL